MAAEVLAGGGAVVTLHDQMPTLGRKLLMAGRGGLNLTHSEPLGDVIARYGPASERMKPIIEAFPPSALRAWVDALGQATFVGSSGRVFPKALKASPLLRAWLARLDERGVELRTRSTWRGWDAEGALVFAGATGEVMTARPDAVVLALGGASWPKLGSDGAWAHILGEAKVELTAFAPANCGFDVAWSPVFAARFAGQPLKAVLISHAGRTVRGEAMITRHGVEGGAIYALSQHLRATIEATGWAGLEIDLRPDLTTAQIAAKLRRPAKGQSRTNQLRKALNISPLEANLLREAHGVDLPGDGFALANRIKHLTLRLVSPRPIARAISTAGGVAFTAVDDELMLKSVPNIYIAGEMLDWEAPTGGYLLQGAIASGAWAARAILTAFASKREAARHPPERSS